ncbi:hypothetical protein [Actibacterium ureilyticum]|uniref:hypothetical protein n=1 Tax=Actibacterium ureilyticum TaxID=1590614 RepID=UPI001596209C|nr:hypothetical protein [Actibacterium ureilyticum]
MRHLILLALLPLAACATPGQRCERAATEDLRVIDLLIAETEANIARGYAITREVDTSPRLRVCYGQGWGHHSRTGVVFCNRNETVVRDRPVAIDLKVEEAKLKSLRAKRNETASRAARRIAACRQQYPVEG